MKYQWVEQQSIIVLNLNKMLLNHYYTSGKSIEEVSKELKVKKYTLSTWIQKARENGDTVNHRGSGNYSSDAEKEIARLKKELRDREDVLEILKKAIDILKD